MNQKGKDVVHNPGTLDIVDDGERWRYNETGVYGGRCTCIESNHIEDGILIDTMNSV